MHISSLFAVALACLVSFSPVRAAERGNSAVEMKRESFISGGKKIEVQTFAPAAPGRYPAVLVLHSSAGTLFGKRELEHFSHLLAERGMVAFFVHYFDRTGTISADDAKIEKHLHAWEDTVHSALDFASAHPRVRRESIGIFGYSLGAFLAVSAASHDARVDAIAELSGGIFTYMGGRLQHVPPMLILHGLADQRVEIHYARELDRVARKNGARPEVHFYPGESHILSDSATADATSRAIVFLRRQLKSPR